MLQLDAVVVRNAHVVSQILNNEAVLLLPTKGEVKVVNEVGARVWELIDGARTVRSIVALVCAEYDVSSAQAEADIMQFLGDLAARDMVSLTRST